MSSDAVRSDVLLANVETLPARYKHTDAGLIPEDWSASTVGAEFTVQLGKMLDAEKNVGEPKVYLGNRAVQWGRVDLEELSVVPMTPSDIQRFRLRAGDLLVCEGGEIGRAAIWTGAIGECYYQKALHRLRPKRGYEAHVLLSFLQLWTATGRLANYVTQTSIAHLPKDKLEKVPLPVPPVGEQRAIAEALSDVDALLGSLDALIAKKRAIKQAAMQQLLTGKTRLPWFVGEWETKRLGELGTTYGGLTAKSKADFGIGAAKYVTFMNVITNTVIDDEIFESVCVSLSETQNRVERGDLLFNGSSETPEEVALCSLVASEVSNLFLNSFCFGFRPLEGAQVNGLFLSYYIRSAEGREIMKSLAQGSTRYNLSKKALLAAEVRTPTFSEQTAIASVLSDMDAEITALETRRDKTRAIKQGMMQQLLTGRIRLVEAQAA